MLTTIELPSFMGGGLSLALILSTILVTSVKLSVTAALMITNIVKPLHVIIHTLPLHTWY
jgi:hypothetical protein